MRAERENVGFEKGKNGSVSQSILLTAGEGGICRSNRIAIWV